MFRYLSAVASFLKQPLSVASNFMFWFHHKSWRWRLSIVALHNDYLQCFDAHDHLHITDKRLQQRKKKRLQSPQRFGWSLKWWLVWGMFPPNGCSSQTDCSRKCRPITIWCSSYYQVMPLKIPVRGDKFAINHFFGVNFCKIIWYKLLHHIAIEEKTHLIVPLKK